MYRISEDGFLEPLMGDLDKINVGDQKLPKVFRHIGTADVIRPSTILEKKHMSGSKILAVPVKKAYSGINELEDWDYYEFLISRKGR
jgi:hypothetical protein